MTEVPLEVLVAALRWEGVDQPHTVLATTARWLDEDARHARDRRLHNDLTDDIRAAAEILARPTAECYGWTSTPTEETALLAAARGTRAILVTRTDDVVVLKRIEPSGLIDAVVARLPQTPAATGQAVNVPGTELDGDSPSSDVRMLRTLMARPRSGSGQLHVAARDRLGRRRRSPNPLSYLDILGGRWMTRATADGWVHAAPATGQLITTTLDRMRRQLG